MALGLVYFFLVIWHDTTMGVVTQHLALTLIIGCFLLWSSFVLGQANPELLLIWAWNVSLCCTEVKRAFTLFIHVLLFAKVLRSLLSFCLKVKFSDELEYFS